MMTAENPESILHISSEAQWEKKPFDYACEKLLDRTDIVRWAEIMQADCNAKLPMCLMTTSLPGQRDNHSSVCFVQLAVGMMHNSLLHRPSPKSPRSEFDMISRLKARLADVYLPSMTEESLLWACNQTTLRDFSSFPS
jgi:hypothetical protein